MTGHTPVNILMVDDQPAKLLSYEVILAELGENLIKATSGREALDALLKHDIAVVLMDVSMPEIDGFELADMIRQHPRFQKTAIIFISGVHLSDEDRINGYKRGAVDYISVPVVPEVLRAKVSVFVELHRKTRLLESMNNDLENLVAERTDKLRDSELQFRTLANSIPQLAWMANPDGSIFWYNERWYEFTGMSESELNEFGWREVIHPQHVSRIDEGLQRSWKSGDQWEDTFPMRRRDGMYRWFLTRALPAHDAQGNIVRWLGTGTDISDQINAEAEIRELNRKLGERVTELETIMQVLPVGIAMSRDAQGTNVTGNAAFRELFGQDAGAIGKGESKAGEGEVFKSGKRVPTEKLPLQKAALTGKLVGSTELQVRFADGTVKHVLASASPLLDDGEVRGAVGAFFDVTERKVLEDKLRERAELLELASEAVMVRDLNGNLLFWNSGAEAMYGYKREEILGQTVHDVLKTVFPVSLGDVEDALRVHGAWEGNLVQRTKEGREVVVSSRKAMNREGTAVLEINRDITSRIQAEEALRNAEKLAAMGRVAGIIAHEINNPLEAITNAFYLLRRHPSLDKEAQHFAELAEQELQRVSHITRQTLSFYRESKQPIPVSIPELIDNVLELQLRRLQVSRVQLRKQYATAGVIQGFPVELRQVFLNLISNSIQAMPDGGILRLKVREETDKQTRVRGVCVTVVDTGTGIKQEDARHIFEPFFSTKATKGTGLGLWISRGIVQKYEGRIAFRSIRFGTQNMTCFRVFLPVGRTANPIPQEIRLEQEATKGTYGAA